MRPDFNNDDYAIACCVSRWLLVKQITVLRCSCKPRETMLLYAINGGVDEKLKMQVGRNLNQSKATF